jgi:GT2 family glycosyltransferase
MADGKPKGGNPPHPIYIAQRIRLMALSIIIVNFNTEKLLKGCLESVYAGANGTPMSISVVDNNSHDGSVPMVKLHFPKVQIIENRQNLGFSKANNMVISQSRCDYILLLNPDTLIIGDAIERVVKFMEQNPKVGIAGCKVLNRDGTLQLACRRSIPTPKVAFFRLTGLSKLFPRSKAMAAYNLTYTDPEQTHEVGAVSGAFLMIRKKVVDEIGLLDERFFMYGEELDWCLRAKRAGWLVMYHPDAQIVHYKGESAKSNSRKAALEFHRAMYLFHRKHFAKDHSCIMNALIYAGIFVRALGSWRQVLFSPRVQSVSEHS